MHQLKLCINILFAMTFFLAVTAFAQTAALPAPTPAMAPSDFQSAVRSLGQQNQSALIQQFNQQNGKTSAPPPNVPSTFAPQTSTENNPQTSTGTQQAQQPVNPPPPVIVQTPAVGPQPTPTSPSFAGAPATTTLAPVPPAPQQQQIYTGFGAGSNSSGTKNTTNNPSSGNSSGWNIGY